MPTYDTHDLRRKAQRLTDLRRRYKAHDTLSESEMEELQRGAPADEYHEIIASIRGERRAATPAKKGVEKKAKATKDKAKSSPITDLNQFLDEEIEPPLPL